MSDEIQIHKVAEVFRAFGSGVQMAVFSPPVVDSPDMDDHEPPRGPTKGAFIVCSILELWQEIIVFQNINCLMAAERIVLASISNVISLLNIMSNALAYISRSDV